jgi:hypothetical protein
VFNKKSQIEILKLLTREEKNSLKMFQSGDPCLAEDKVAEANEGLGEKDVKKSYIDD